MSRSSTSSRKRESFLSLNADDALDVARSASRPQLILVRGLPGSGKSTLAKKFIELEYKHIEADMYFFIHGRYVFRRSELRQAHEWCFNAARYSLSQGHNLVVSNIFSKLSDMNPYLELVSSHIVIQPNGLHTNIHHVAPATISKIEGNWEPVDRVRID